MILIDFNEIAMSKLMESRIGYRNYKRFKNVVFSTLCMYDKKFREEYGEMVICADGLSWRHEVFPYYRHTRNFERKFQQDTGFVNWSGIFSSFDEILNEIDKHFHWKVVRHSRAEASDVISTLVMNNKTSDQNKKIMEKIMIISDDEKYNQLQKYLSVSQYFPYRKRVIAGKYPIEHYLLRDIIYGDVGNSIPNILSSDDVFVSENRQKLIPEIRYWKIIENKNRLKEYLSENEYRNFERNRQLFDHTQLPSDIYSEILNIYFHAHNE